MMGQLQAAWELSGLWEQLQWSTVDSAFELTCLVRKNLDQLNAFYLIIVKFTVC
jgi:hypothetical protein